MKKYILLFLLVLISTGNAFAQGGGAQAATDTDESKYTIKDYLEKNLPPNENRKIALDEITGLLTITDTPSNQALVRRLINDWDVGPRQVFIEAKIMELNVTDLVDIGFEWLVDREASAISRKNSNVYIGSGSAANPGTGARPPYTGTNLNVPADYAGFGVLLTKSQLSGSELQLYIKALEQKGKANLLSAPKITTLSGQMANIQVATTIPYAKSSNRINMGGTDPPGGANPQIWVETYEIAEQNYGVSLEVTPTVAPGSNIIKLDIHPEVTNLITQIPIINSVELADTSVGNLGWPVIDTRTNKTSVMLKTGETIVIAGLIRDADTTEVRQVPILGDIPYFGEFFKSTQINRVKTNLVIFLTASLINSEGDPANN